MLLHVSVRHQFRAATARRKEDDAEERAVKFGAEFVDEESSQATNGVEQDLIREICGRHVDTVGLSQSDLDAIILVIVMSIWNPRIRVIGSDQTTNVVKGANECQRGPTRIYQMAESGESEEDKSARDSVVLLLR